MLTSDSIDARHILEFHDHFAGHYLLRAPADVRAQHHGIRSVGSTTGRNWSFRACCERSDGNSRYRSRDKTGHLPTSSVKSTTPQTLAAVVSQRRVSRMRAGEKAEL